MKTVLPDLHHCEFNNFHLVYIDDVESGGLGYREVIKDVVVRTGSKSHYNHAHEWCCGHGAMGYNLLVENICDQLTLSDCYYNCMLSCKITASVNEIQHKVNLCLIDELTDIAVPAQPWDLIVSNPPYAPERTLFDLNRIPMPLRESKWVDPGWKSHRIFFENLHQYTADQCDIYMFGMWEFIQGQINLAKDNGFELVDIYDDLKQTGNLIELMHFRRS